jgi:uncharacterized protein (TIGR03083 family)
VSTAVSREAQEQVVAVLAEVWQAIAELGSGLSDPEWDLPSECPGWTVKDLVSHLVGVERALLGDPAPPMPAARAPHVHNDMGAVNEAWVSARRAVSGPDVLEEFRAVTARRLDQLAAFRTERFDELVPSPVGQVPYREFMRVRVMDCWVHEQDIRVATGRPGHRQGPAADIALDRITSAMPFVVAKRAGVPDGCGVRFELSGSPARRIDVAVHGGRGVVEDLEQPDVTVTVDTELFWRLGCGRVTGEAALGAGLVGLNGDVALGQAVVRHMAFMI